MGACSTFAADDLLAGYNHRMFNGNKAVDQAMFEPVAKGYRKITPQPVRGSINNALANLRAPTDLLNNILQGKIGAAVDTTVRFGINSTLGLAGLFDPATDMGITAKPEDFGQTLAVWGVESGSYLVLPFLGPSNGRDSVGLVVDVVTHPFFLVQYQGATIAQVSRFSINSLGLRTEAIELIDNLDENSLDEYAAYRSLYEQARDHAIRDGAIAIDDLPDFDEFDDDY
ncbi:MAG: VacJ family lipoprotein [Robiginitomaculum sp.]|nr:VacJ family lipoprotein [Robiginitomaculum sp.]